MLILFFLRLKYRITMAWSKWRKPTAKIPPVLSPGEIPVRIGFGTRYRRDLKFRDRLAHPQCFQARLDAGELTYDCEDHATYWAVTLLKSGLCSKVGLGLVYWFDPAGKKVGHAVCVYEDGEGRKYWADYHAPVFIEQGKPWWEFGRMVTDIFPGSRLRRISYVEITHAKADDTPVMDGEHKTLTF